MANDIVKLESSQKSGLGVRGISYPAISLAEAVDRARQLWEHEHKNSAPLEAVAEHWGYSPTSSGVRTVVAALLSFGLVSDRGSGRQREIQLSPRGLDIVLDTPERDDALRQAVASPKIYAELLATWPASNLPSDQSLKVHLLRNKNFNPKAVDGFIKDFKDSIGFSGLTKAANIPESQIGNAENSDMQQGMQGIADGRGAAQQVAPTLLVASPAPSSDREWLRGALSKDTQFRLLVAGEIGPKEIGKLIKLLEAQKAVLDDDSE